MPIRLTFNGKPFDFDGDPDKPLLWVLREDAGLTGTKYGCGVAACGACTVHLDGVATRSCSLPVEASGRQRRSSRSRALRPPTATSAIRCSRPGSSSRCRNAAIASRA